uniref:Folate transporter 1 n=1 Tax=Cacopsylla melanoneura TaxID=428564 RepID=A0A8D8YTM3_9HEMI
MTLEQTTPDIRESDSTVEPAINLINENLHSNNNHANSHPCKNASIEDHIEPKSNNSNCVEHGQHAEDGVTSSTVEELNEYSEASTKCSNRLNSDNHSETFKNDLQTCKGDRLSPVHSVNKEVIDAAQTSNNSSVHTLEYDDVSFDESKTAKLPEAPIETARTPNGIQVTLVATNKSEKSNGYIDNPKEAPDHHNHLNDPNGLPGTSDISAVASPNDVSFVKETILPSDTNANETNRPSNGNSAPDPNCPIDASYTINEAGEDLSVNTWQKISVLICVFAILREFHPIESYFVRYLELVNPSFTKEVVKSSIYPIGTYSSLLLMVITFLITDYTRYKPIVVLDVLAGLLSYVLIVESPTMPIMWVQQVCIGFYHAGEVSYYSYMYSKIKDKNNYQRATGRVKASIMIGRFLAGMSGQGIVLLFSTDGYKYLVYLSILGMSAAVLWTCLLPPVEESVYFHTPATLFTETSQLHPVPTHQKKWGSVVKAIWCDFRTAFSQVEIIKWSVWWILGMGGYISVITYNQILWSTLNKEDPVNNRLMNGAVDAIFPLAGAVSTFTIGKVSLHWTRWGELMLAAGTLIQGILLVITSTSTSLVLVYFYYIVFGCIHYTMLTIASSEIAKYLKRESFALVFGFNKFVALLGVSLFTLYKVQLVNTPTRELYLIFGVYFISIGLIYFAASLYRTMKAITELPTSV